MAYWPLQRLTEDLKGAALAPERWAAVLEDISDAIGGAGALLFSADRRFPEPLGSSKIAESISDYGRQGWHLHDERYLGVPIMEHTGIITDLDCLTTEQMKKSQFYQDFLGKYDLSFFAGLGFKAAGDLWCLSIQRNASQGFFQGTELQLLKSLHRPFCDAATLARQFDQTRLVGMTDALETVQHAAFVCDSAGCIVRMNAAAETLVGSTVRGAERTLGLQSARCADAFLWMVRQALRPHETSDVGPLTVDVQDVQGNYLTMRAIRIEGLGRFLFADGAVLVLIKRRPRTNERSLVETFGLTSAEVRVAKAFYTGHSVRDISALHGVKEDTVRTQLKSIYAKTDTHRQSELVAFLARLWI